MLRGEKTSLRALRDGDIEYIIEWWNDFEVVKYFPFYAPATSYTVGHWVESEMQKPNNPFFVIVPSRTENQDEPPIGYCGLREEGREVDHMKNLKILIGKKEEWNRGYGTDACRTVVRFGFQCLNLNRINANCFGPNAASKKMLGKVGFIREGTQQKAYFIDGEYVDYVLYGLRVDDWKRAQGV